MTALVLDPASYWREALRSKAAVEAVSNKNHRKTLGSDLT
jgi:hypothetical protein